MKNIFLLDCNDIDLSELEKHHAESDIERCCGRLVIQRRINPYPIITAALESSELVATGRQQSASWH